MWSDKRLIGGFSKNQNREEGLGAQVRGKKIKNRFNDKVYVGES